MVTSSVYNRKIQEQGKKAAVVVTSSHHFIISYSNTKPKHEEDLTVNMLFSGVIT